MQDSTKQRLKIVSSKKEPKEPTLKEQVLALDKRMAKLETALIAIVKSRT